MTHRQITADFRNQGGENEFYENIIDLLNMYR